MNRPVSGGRHCGGADGSAGGGGAGRDLRFRLHGSSGRGVYHRHQPGHHRADERRPYHRHHSPLGGKRPVRAGSRGLCGAGVSHLPAAVRADSILLRAGDPVRAGGGAAGAVCRRRRRCGGHGLPVRLRPCESGDAHCRRGDGGAGAGTDSLRKMAEIRVEADPDLSAADGSAADCRRRAVSRPPPHFAAGVSAAEDGV